MIDLDYVPETIDWCAAHYVPPVKKYISCSDFGKCDGMNGSCIWCSKMTAYQWHMCADQSWVNNLLSEFSRAGCKTLEDAISHIEKYKSGSIAHRFGLKIAESNR